MTGREKKIEAGRATRFSSERQPKKNGRKPSRLTKLIKDSGVSSDDVNAIIKSLIFTKTETELQRLMEDPVEPMLVRLFVKAFLSDFKAGTLHNIDKLLARAMPVTEKKEVTQTVVSISDELSKELIERSKELVEGAVHD